ncbi:MAG: carboxypeptidase-like regulatory domain-containing protein [Candidatus Riflebacteria bacterium]|nr:carboxypeptidase-like regulatory domain-containing protein [Candidatus Riflebacteria bacterium]
MNRLYGAINQWLRSRQNRLLSLFFLAALLLVGCENQMGTQRGVVSGTITDMNGHLIKDAVVTSHRSLFKAETDEKGAYSFTSLDVGSHRLKVERTGYYLASKTIELGYGLVQEGINFKLEPLEDMISFVISRRGTDNVVIDINCQEPMSVWLGWREMHSARVQTQPTQTLAQHQITLGGLFPGADYLFEVEGVTADGRRFISAQGSFKTVPRGDLAGAPDSVTNFKVGQSVAGPVLSWKYEGIDPVTGFRVYRGVNGGSMGLIQDESMLFAVEEQYLDENTVPGRLYSYAVQSVDLDGNVSSLSASLSIVPAGKISEDLVWEKSWSPISINGDIIVPAGRTIEIKPGVTVLFSSVDEAHTGYRPEICELIVEGTLLAAGNENESIRFISASALAGKSDWDGLRLVAGSDQNPSVLRHLVISGAEKGLTLYDGTYEVGNITTRFCQTGVALQGASGTALLDMTFEDCDYGFMAESTYNCSLENVTVQGGLVGLSLAGNSNFSLSRFDVRNVREVAVKVVDRSSPHLRNGVMQSQQTGLLVGSCSGDHQYLTVDAVNGIIVDGADVQTIRNCIIVNMRQPRTGNGIEDKTLGRSYLYDNIFGFLQATFNCDQLGAPIVNADPRFVGGTGEDYDYHLKADSPLTSASDSNGQPGAYGSGS